MLAHFCLSGLLRRNSWGQNLCCSLQVTAPLGMRSDQVCSQGASWNICLVDVGLCFPVCLLGISSRFDFGLSRVTDYSLAVRFSVVTSYKFTNRLTRSCTDDLLETWSCQNHENVEETPVNPSYIWAKMCLLSVFGSLTGPPGSQSIGIFSH